MRKIRWYSKNQKLGTWMMDSLNTTLQTSKIHLSSNSTNINNIINNRNKLPKFKTLTICNKMTNGGIAALMSPQPDGVSVNVTPT